MGKAQALGEPDSDPIQKIKEGFLEEVASKEGELARLREKRGRPRQWGKVFWAVEAA